MAPAMPRLVTCARVRSIKSSLPAVISRAAVLTESLASPTRPRALNGHVAVVRKLTKHALEVGVDGLRQIVVGQRVQDARYLAERLIARFHHPIPAVRHLQHEAGFAGFLDALREIARGGCGDDLLRRCASLKILLSTRSGLRMEILA